MSALYTGATQAAGRRQVLFFTLVRGFVQQLIVAGMVGISSRIHYR
jgi:hypothetical protein